MEDKQNKDQGETRKRIRDFIIIFVVYWILFIPLTVICSLGIEYYPQHRIEEPLWFQAVAWLDKLLLFPWRWLWVAMGMSIAGMSLLMLANALTWTAVITVLLSWRRKRKWASPGRCACSQECEGEEETEKPQSHLGG